MFFEGYISHDLDSAEVFRGIGIFCRFFALKVFLSYRHLKKVWADTPTAVRFRVKTIFCSGTISDRKFSMNANCRKRQLCTLYEFSYQKKGIFIGSQFKKMPLFPSSQLKQFLKQFFL
jgi:hypothetical protein